MTGIGAAVTTLILWLALKNLIKSLLHYDELMEKEFGPNYKGRMERIGAQAADKLLDRLFRRGAGR